MGFHWHFSHRAFSNIHRLSIFNLLSNFPPKSSSTIKFSRSAQMNLKLGPLNNASKVERRKKRVSGCEGEENYMEILFALRLTHSLVRFSLFFPLPLPSSQHENLWKLCVKNEKQGCYDSSLLAVCECCAKNILEALGNFLPRHPTSSRTEGRRRRKVDEWKRLSDSYQIMRATHSNQTQMKCMNGDVELMHSSSANDVYNPDVMSMKRNKLCAFVIRRRATQWEMWHESASSPTYS